MLDQSQVKIKVSSTLNKDVKSWGKQFLIDKSSETCWNSDQGSPQWISLEFPSKIKPKQIDLTFQGGFAGKECIFYSVDENKTLSEIIKFWPEDINTKQSFKINSDESLLKDGFLRFKLVFNESTDFYGRTTVYDLDLLW